MKQIETIRLLDFENAIIEKNKSIDALNKEIFQTSQELKEFLPKGYWWSYDVDTSWHKPKKYSIKDVTSTCYGVTITVKEVFKKKPWPGFTGEHRYDLKDFCNLHIYQTEQEAIELYPKRACPKCGNAMGWVKDTWCAACMNKRRSDAKEFEKNHKYYSPVIQCSYHVGYTDQFTRTRGYDGHIFTFRVKETGEIIRTNNLWEDHRGPNTNNLPEIEFITEEQ